MVGYNIKIITSEIGYVNNLQRYVIGAKIEPIVDTWHWQSSQAQKFQQVVHISEHKLLPEDLLNSHTSEWNFVMLSLPPDVFYPLALDN